MRTWPSVVPTRVVPVELGIVEAGFDHDPFAREPPAPSTDPATVPATMKVREVIAMLRADGWHLDRQVGSHRQFRHPTKAGTVTIAGNLGNDLKPGTLASIRRQAGLRGDRST
jgi:predicted RNA binding protein YcfA (HicA-like mRNA interferase family)